MQTESTPTTPVTRTVIVYRATDMFQCAVAAVMHTKNIRTICWINNKDDKMKELRETILSDKPHNVIFFDDKWPQNLINSMRMINPETADKPDETADEVKPDETVAADEVKPDETVAVAEVKPDDFEPIVDEVVFPIIVMLSAQNETTDNIVKLCPRAFRAFIPCDNVISAEMIADYMFTAKFPNEFENFDQNDAKMFVLGLRGSTGSTLQTYTYIRDIVSNWQQVMVPEQLITYGKVVANIGSTISIDHHKLYSHMYHIPRSNAIFSTCNQPSDEQFVNICFVEAPNQYTRAHPKKDIDFTIGYNIDHNNVTIQIVLPTDNESSFAQNYFNSIAVSDKTIDGIMYATISRDSWFTYVDALDKIMNDLCAV